MFLYFLRTRLGFLKGWEKEALSPQEKVAIQDVDKARQKQQELIQKLNGLQTGQEESVVYTYELDGSVTVKDKEPVYKLDGDATPPTTPVVIDGGTYTASTTQLQIGWSGCSDPESYIAAGQYAIGTTSGGTDVRGWTQFMPPCPPNPFFIGGLSLISGKTYYINLKFQNYAGIWSAAGNSDGIKVDTSAPITPVITDDGVYTTSTSQLHAVWTSSDAQSTIVEYQYAIGTTAGGTDTVAWTSTGTTPSVTKTGLTLINGKTYYFTAKAKNGAGTWSATGNSDGIMVMVSEGLLKGLRLKTKYHRLQN